MRNDIFIATPNGAVVTEDYIAQHGNPKTTVFIEAATGRILGPGDLNGTGNTVQNPSLVGKISRAFKTLFAKEPTALSRPDQSHQKISTATTPSPWGGHTNPFGWGSASGDLTARAVNAMRLARDRVSNLNLYDEMLEQDEYLAAGGFIYADYAARGDSDQDEGGFAVEVGSGVRIDGKRPLREQYLQTEATGSDAKIQRAVIQVMEDLNLRDAFHGDAYSLYKYGESWRELVIGPDGRLSRYKYVNPHTMWMNTDVYGNTVNPQEAYIHVDPSSGKTRAVMPSWQMVQYTLATDPSRPYGTAIMHPCRKVYKQLRMTKDSLVVARLHRAPARYVFIVDVPGGRVTSTEAIQYAQDMREQLLMRQTVGGENSMGSEEAPLAADFDFFIPQTQEGKSDVKMLDGDVNVSNLADIEMFINMMLAVISIPHSYLGMSDGIGRGEVSQQEVNFMRRVRSVRSAGRPGLKKTIQVGVYSYTGIWIPTRDIKVTFPKMGMIDDLRMAQIKQMEHAVAVIDKDALHLPPTWIAQNILKLDADEAKIWIAYDEKIKKEQKAEIKQQQAAASRPQFATGKGGEKQRVPKTATRGLPGGGRQNGPSGAGERTTAESLQLLRSGKINIQTLLDSLEGNEAFQTAIRNSKELTAMRLED